jgi:hypothetical protein
MRRLLVLLMSSLVLCACVIPVQHAQLVKPGKVKVAEGALTVSLGTAWNRLYGNASEERWTQNGSLLDEITFVAGLRDGTAITGQSLNGNGRAPTFTADMSPDELVAMVESYYRISVPAQVFHTTAVAPTTFLGTGAVQFDYEYVGPDGLRRRGRCVIGIQASKLYMISLDGAALHYFDAALPEFQAIVASASIP